MSRSCIAFPAPTLRSSRRCPPDGRHRDRLPRVLRNSDRGRYLLRHPHQEEQLLQFKTVGDIQRHLESLNIDPPVPNRLTVAAVRQQLSQRVSIVGWGSVSPLGCDAAPPGRRVGGPLRHPSLRAAWSEDLRCAFRAACPSSDRIPGTSAVAALRQLRPARASGRQGGLGHGFRVNQRD